MLIDVSRIFLLCLRSLSCSRCDWVSSFWNEPPKNMQSPSSTRRLIMVNMMKMSCGRQRKLILHEHLVKISPSASCRQKLVVTFSSVLSQLNIRPDQDISWDCESKVGLDNTSFKWCLQWRQTASQPAAMEVGVSGPHGPLLFSPTAFILRQNHFQAALLCSQCCCSALCVGGRELSRQRNSRNSNLHSCSLSILESVPHHNYLNLNMAWMYNHALCAMCAMVCAQLSNQ